MLATRLHRSSRWPPPPAAPPVETTAAVTTAAPPVATTAVATTVVPATEAATTAAPPVVTTAAATTPACPPPTLEPLLVEPAVSPTNQLNAIIVVRIGNGDQVTVASESGTFQVSGNFSVNAPAQVTIPLLPN